MVAALVGAGRETGAGDFSITAPRLLQVPTKVPCERIAHPNPREKEEAQHSTSFAATPTLGTGT